MAAHTLQLDLKRAERMMVFRVWQGLLPKGSGAPRFTYVAAKKPPAAESLTVRMMQVLGESRPVVEEMQVVIALAGKEEELYIYYGIEPPVGEDKKPTPDPLVVKKGGLLDG